MTADEALRVLTEEAEALLDGRPGRVLVGIAGPPGTGKSTFARRVVENLGPAAAYVPMDGFHLSSTQLTRLGRLDRKGAPDTFDVDGYRATLARIAADHRVRDVYIPDFDRALEEPVAAGRVVPADARLVVTEGNYLGLWDGVPALLDRLYYLDSAPAVRRARLIARHVAGGRSEHDARRWVETVDEANARLIADTRDRCDRVLEVDAAQPVSGGD
ncbi:nucleoside/nucleotide kinase family protein [Mycobacterium sp. GA-2829]|uniref:nucleoside/nucleotide kinase family protein n=1 Tax=Mycobacterium sp. GA-2829 TaxID=1772283 RepID=UPI00073FC785|nr:nucleoside/nucleotide kinase family protein [Mycobacterium sp. GA-2829]KUI27603.1 nucleoside triphosphate hydrolase [Mycobacterium sp. GA-2829]